MASVGALDTATSEKFKQKISGLAVVLERLISAGRPIRYNVTETLRMFFHAAIDKKRGTI